jgi:hypothetical protein
MSGQPYCCQCHCAVSPSRVVKKGVLEFCSTNCLDAWNASKGGEPLPIKH